MILHWPEVKISEDIIPNVSQQPKLMKAAAIAGELLGQRLREENDRKKTTQTMQAKLMAMFGETV